MESKKTQSKKKLTLLVRAVYSGDQIQVAETLFPVLGARIQRYYLAFTAAPILGKTDDAYYQQPCAFAARQFLRKRLIGQKVSLHQEYKFNNKTYVTVFHNSQNINHLMIANGLSKLITRKQESFQKMKDQYIEASEIAQNSKLGIYADDSQQNRRKLLSSNDQDFNLKSLVEKAVLLEKPVGGIVEYMLSASSFNIYLKYFDAILKINLPYIQPIANKVDPKISAQGKLHSESLLLSKTVGVVIVGQDPYNGNILGKLIHPAGDIAKEVVKRGFAKVFVPQKSSQNSGLDNKSSDEIVSMKFDSDYFSDLKAIQANAKKRKVGIWKNQIRSKHDDQIQRFDSQEQEQKIDQTIKDQQIDAQTDRPPPVNNKYHKQGGSFIAHVVQVISGDMIGIALKKFDVENLMRVSVAGIRAPTFARRGFQESKGPKKASGTIQSDQPCAWESKQFLRKLLIGKQVYIFIEKIKKTLQGNTLTIASVQIKRGSYAYQNVGQSILAKGMANIVMPKVDQEIIKNFTQLTKAQQKAKKSKLGVHSPKKNQSVTPKFKQLCGKQYKASAKQYSRFLLKKQKLDAVVQQVIGINRYKVRLANQDCRISFSCQGVRSLRVNSKQLESYDREGFRFSKQLLLQRDCFVDIDSIDIHGVYYGSLRLKEKIFHEDRSITQNDFSVLLAYNGLVFIDKRGGGGGGPTPDIQKALSQAQKQAQEDKRGFWAEDMSLFIQKELINSQSSTISSVDTINLKSQIKQAQVCDMYDATSFHIQFIEDFKQLDQITQIIKDQNWDEADKPQSLKNGAKCIALFSADDEWYRAEILQRVSDSEIKVRFLDYGNEDNVLLGNVRKMPKALFNFKPIARPAKLALIRPFGLKSSNLQIGQQAGKAFRTMVWQRKVLLQIVNSWKGVSEVVIWRSAAQKGDYKKSVNAILLEKGFANFDKLSVKGDIGKILESARQVAKDHHYGIFQGDEDMSDDDQY